jgi:hypothetical protein
VAFPSDQGLFITPPGNGSTFVVANGNLCERRRAACLGFARAWQGDERLPFSH